MPERVQQHNWCHVVKLTLRQAYCLQAVTRSSEDKVLEASLENVHQQPHAQFCTTLGNGEDRCNLTVMLSL